MIKSYIQTSLPSMYQKIIFRLGIAEDKHLNIHWVASLKRSHMFFLYKCKIAYLDLLLCLIFLCIEFFYIYNTWCSVLSLILPHFHTHYDLRQGKKLVRIWVWQFIKHLLYKLFCEVEIKNKATKLKKIGKRVPKIHYLVKTKQNSMKSNGAPPS